MNLLILTWLKDSKPMHSMPLSMPLSWTESLDHLEHVMGPCWCFWAGPHHNVIKRLILELASKNQVICFILFLLVSASLALVVCNSVFDYFMSRLGGLHLPQYTNKENLDQNNLEISQNLFTGSRILIAPHINLAHLEIVYYGNQGHD
jgi:hypothetical protein